MHHPSARKTRLACLLILLALGAAAVANAASSRVSPVRALNRWARKVGRAPSPSPLPDEDAPFSPSAAVHPSSHHPPSPPHANVNSQDTYSGGNNANAPCRVVVMGAGVGGLWTAFRLVNASTYLPRDVCVFEKTDRVGGRQYSLRNAFPPSTGAVDLGARRWDPKVHKIMDALVKKVLKLPHACASASGTCSDAADDSIYYSFRNGYTGNLSSSDGIPYSLDEAERWTADEDFPDPIVELLVRYYPSVLEAYEDLTSSSDAVRYTAIRQVLGDLRTQLVAGMAPSRYDAATLLSNHSTEYWDLVRNVWGEDDYVLRVNLYDAIRESVLYAAESDVKRMVVDPATGMPAGYAQTSEGLAALLASRGVRIRYGREVASLRRDASSPSSYLVGFADGTAVSAEKVVLNIPIAQLQRLGADSVVFREASPVALQALRLTTPVAAVKLYGWWSDAWWMTRLGLRGGEMSTTLPILNFKWSDGRVTCTNPRRCQGFVIMAYPDGNIAAAFRNPRPDLASPATVIRANETDPARKRWFDDIHAQFLEVHAQFFAAKGIDPATIPKAEVIALGVWPEAWHYYPASDQLGGQPSSVLLKPAPTADVFLVNEAYSIDQGWAEGSLIAAEKVLSSYFGLSRPSWLGNQHWWNAIIANQYI